MVKVPGTTLVVFLMDKSGSMAKRRQAAIEGFNAYKKEVAEGAPTT